MDLQIKGKIIVINETKVVSANFQKREFVIETGEEYKQTIMVEVHKDKTELLDQFNVGDFVDASINLRGKAWTNPQTNETRYFNTLVCWRMSVVESEVMNENADNVTTTKEEVEPDGLPF